MKPYHDRNRRVLLLSMFALLLVIAGWALPAAGETLCAEVKIEIAQELTLERQAFEAHMRINNGLTHLTLEDVSVTVNFADEEGNTVEATSDTSSTTAKFFIRLDTLENLGNVQRDPNNLDFTATVSPSTSADIYWLIIPAPDASDGVPQGKLYYVGATLRYTMGGDEQVVEVSPDYIFVKPMPQLQLDYFLPHEVFGDDAFTPEIEDAVPYSLGVRVKNFGAGDANSLAIESAQPKIVENKQGLLIDFLITGSEVNGEEETPSLLVDFGDIAAGTAGVARWIMECTLSGKFTEFTAELSHADELGGDLTALIDEEDLYTHFLIHDVLVDLPGRDSIRDFLATPDTATLPTHDTVSYMVYESDNQDNDVQDLSDYASLTAAGGDASAMTLSFDLPALAGLLYVSLPDPSQGEQELQAVRRADGKQLKRANFWQSKRRKADPEDGWDYYLNVFDSLAMPLEGGQYSLSFAGEIVEPQPPALAAIQDQTGLEGDALSFAVSASCAADTEPCELSLSAAPLPTGATFTDNGDGTGLFAWTPQVGQKGDYVVTVDVSDGSQSASQDVTISIGALEYTITASAGNGGTISPAGATIVPYGGSQSFTVTPDEGYQIVELLLNGASVDFDGQTDEYDFVIGATLSLSNVTQDHTIEAVFGLKHYPILSAAGTGGSITPEGETQVDHGADQSFSITPETGYHIADVLVDGVSVGAVESYEFTNVTAAHTIQASFAIDTFKLTASAGTGGSITPAGETTAEYGASQSFSIRPDEGYHIVDVLVDGVPVGAMDSYEFTNVIAAHTIEALFEAQSTTNYLIHAGAGTGGSITPSGAVSVEAGANQRFDISAEAGYQIVNVLVDGVSVGALASYEFTNVSAAHTIQALFDIAASLSFGGASFDLGGESYSSDETLPDAFHDSRFDWSSGTGSLSVDVRPGEAGDYTLLGAFDYLLSCEAVDCDSLAVDTVGTFDDGQLLDVSVDNGAFSVTPGWMVSLEHDGDWVSWTIDIGTVIPQEGPYTIISWVGAFGIEQLVISTRMVVHSIPEPATVALFIVGGLLGLAAWRRRKS